MSVDGARAHVRTRTSSCGIDEIRMCARAGLGLQMPKKDESMTSVATRRKCVTSGSGHRGTRPPPRVAEVVRDALDTSVTKRRSRCTLDKRFRWHIMDAYEMDTADAGSRDDESEASSEAALAVTKVHSRSSKTVPHEVYASILRETSLLRELVFAIQLRVAEKVGARAKVVLGGSTGMRMEVAGDKRIHETLVREAFPVSDIDVDVYACDDEACNAAVEAVDQACADIVCDKRLQFQLAHSLPDYLTSVDCRTNMRLYKVNEAGKTVAIDVPMLSDKVPRMPFAPLFATRNDTLRDVTLHRIRFACRAAEGKPGKHDIVSQMPKSIPIMDIKTHVASPPCTVERIVGGVRMRVPEARSCVAELTSLLERHYTDVDERKDEKRRKQLDIMLMRCERKLRR